MAFSPAARSGALASPRKLWPSTWPNPLARLNLSLTAPPVDPVLLSTTLALLVFGVVVVFSASAMAAERSFGDGYYFAKRQIVYAVLGAFVILGASRIGERTMRRMTYPLLLIATLGLAMIAVGMGRTVNGAARWLVLGPVRFQPAELAKLATVLWVAYSLSKKGERIRTFSVGFLPHVLVSGILILLCLKQPDLGSAAMLAWLTLAMLFAGGVRLGYMLGLVAASLPVLYVLVASSKYRLERIKAFLEPFGNRFDSGYQVVESMIGFGAGGLNGTGLGQGQQKFFLPEMHTDFIATLVGEELGYLGMAALVGAYLIILARGLTIALREADVYRSFVAFGVTIFVTSQAAINLCVVMGLLPTKGLSLPFLSYGGSSLLVNCLAVGLLLGLSRRRVTDAPGREGGPDA